MCMSGDCDCCRNQLNLEKLCVDKIKGHCAKIHKIVSDNVCAQSGEFKVLSVENEIVNNICIPGMLQASQVWADKSYANSLCAQSANLQSACINELTVGSLNHCVKWRAAVTFNADQSYALGSPINWNTIIDDPNSNVAMSPFSYTVPASGYYIITLHLDINNIQGSNVISGTPISNSELLINGNPLRNQISAFLSFSSDQNSSLTSLCLLNAGDVITCKYNVLIFDSVSGLMPYIGTVNIKANGSFPGQSGFAVHYLSSLNCSQQVCPPCPPVVIPCNGVVTPCMPLDNPEEPCDSCQ